MSDYNASNYTEQGGARDVIGGSLDVISGGELDIESGGALKLAGTQVTATAAELNKLSGSTVTAQQINALSRFIDSDGDITLLYPQWEDLRFPAAGINPPGAASDPARDTGDGRLSFSASATNIIAIQVQMPHDWLPGSAIEPHIHWSPTDNNAGNVYWRLEYKIANISEAFPGSFTPINTLAAASGTNDMHQIHDAGSISMSGKTISCMILILLSRIGGDGTDTYAGAAKLNEFDIHYQRNSFGSKQELIK